MTITENAVVIGAHPDDELLWFTSVLPKAEKAIIVFKDFWAVPDLGAKRAAAIADYPHKNMVFLELAESGSAGAADWPGAEPDAFGLAFSPKVIAREAKRQTKLALSRMGVDAGATAPVPVRQAYEQNYHDLKAALRDHLKPHHNVFTHNPWGEYGHEDHVLVHRAVSDLRADIGFTQWMSNYCSQRSLPLAQRYFQLDPTPAIRLEADIDYARQIAALYIKHDCWTWANDWAWFTDEYFLEAPTAPRDEARDLGHLFPLNLFSID